MYYGNKIIEDQRKLVVKEEVDNIDALLVLSLSEKKNKGKAALSLTRREGNIIPSSENLSKRLQFDAFPSVSI